MLADIAQTYKPTFLIGTVADLDISKVADMRKVGVTAGASTPEHDVVALVEKLQSI